ncbi:MAG TPA: hypothetical protein VH418_15110 [Solirubrobacteraceae bacterium]|jgi:hypothetical protein
MEAELQRRAHAGASHSWELRWRRRLVARLEWFQDPAWREKTGWYLRRTEPEGDTVFERRLDVDASVAALASDADAPEAEWTASAEVVATLTTDAALAQAEWELRGGTRGSPPQLGPAGGPRRYEIFVRGAAGAELGLAFPRLAVTDGGGFCVLAGTLDVTGLGTTIDRCISLGYEVIGVITDRPHAARRAP